MSSMTTNEFLSGDDEASLLGFYVEYFSLHKNNRNLSKVDFSAPPLGTATVAELNRFMSEEPSWTGLSEWQFAARYTATVTIQTAGAYTFYVTANDGTSIKVGNNSPQVASSGNGFVTTTAVTYVLEAGQHAIEVLNVEWSSKRTLRVEWQGADTGGARQVLSGAPLNGGSGQAIPEDDPSDIVHGAPTPNPPSLPDESDDGTMPDDGTTDHDHGTMPDDGTTDHDHGTMPDDGTTDHDHGTMPDDGTTDHDHGTMPDDGTTDHDHGTMPDDGTTDHDHGTMPDDGTTDHDHGTMPDDGTTDHDHGTMPDDGTTDHDHDHGTGDASLPKTEAEIEAFVAMVKGMPDGHAHSNNAGMAAEHANLLNLVPRAEATHVAIANGDWFDPGTWYQGRIPDAGAKVLIPGGVSVKYDGESDVSIFTVRVDGKLSFATDVDTKLVLDTMVIAPTGRLEIGTADHPVAAGVQAKILIANNGDIDLNWDPSLLSRGVLSHGSVEIHGAEKTAFLKVAADAMAGDTVLHLAETPKGWQVGDTLVLTGTHKQGWTWDNTLKKVVYVESQDEEVVITAIDGNKIIIDRPLSFNHDVPRDDLSAYVANMSRSVTIASEDGDATAVHHRGHVMFMHSDNVDVRYAAFDDLGRTDKSVAAFDIGALDTVSADSNIKGRYSFHFHKTGTADQENPAIAIGNTVSGSPGWGFVHHSSHADFTENVAFDVFGAAFAAEDGDETGIWLRNMAIRAEGFSYGDWSAKNAEDVARHDNGRTGDGFFFAGRLVEAAENIAVNTTHGFVWMHRSAPSGPLAENYDHSEIAFGAEFLSADRAPIQGFRDNEAFGTQIGLIVVKASPMQGHDIRTVMDGFLNWETSRGVDITYTSHYTLLDFDLLGTTNKTAVARAETGFVFGGNAFDIVLNGFTIENFRTGVNFNQPFTFTVTDSDIGHVLIDVTMTNVATEYNGYNPDQHTIMSSDDLIDGQLAFDLAGLTQLNLGQALSLAGLKYDSVGVRDRLFAGDRQEITKSQIESLLRKDGYFVTADGQKVMLITDFIADRATGEILKFSHVVTLNATDAALDKIGAVNSGFIQLGGAAPVTQNDHAQTHAGMDVLIDVLANDFDPEGAALRVDGTVDPKNGDVFLQEDGTLLYRPNHGFTGTDSFSYWAADDAGHFTRATVTVDVWAGA